MELRTVRYFLAVVDEGTVTAAADAVRVTQPALSRQLQLLERELGIELFERSAGRLALSPAGRALVPLARDLLNSAQMLQIGARLQAEGRLAQVTLAAPTTTLTDVVAPFIATLQPEDPTPQVFASDGLEATEALQRGADIVITNHRPRPPLSVLPIAVLPVWAYVPPEHPWARTEVVGLADLLAEVVIALPPVFSARQALDVAIERLRAAPHALVEASSGTVAQALAAAGRGVAVVSNDSRFGLHGVLIDGDAEYLCVHLFAAWSPRHPAKNLLSSLSERLRDYVLARYGDSAEAWRAHGG